MNQPESMNDNMLEPLSVRINKILFKNNFQGQEGTEGGIIKVYKEPSEGDGYVHFLDYVEGSQVYTNVKNYQLYTLNMSSYQLYFNTAIILIKINF